MPAYNVREAKLVTIMRPGKPVAKLVPFIEPSPPTRKLGWAAGMVVEAEGWEKAMTDEEVEALLGRRP